VTVLNGRIYGQDDRRRLRRTPPLFATLAQLLPPTRSGSPASLQRTHQTAAAIAAAGPLTLRRRWFEPDFAEQHFGECKA